MGKLKQNLKDGHIKNIQLTCCSLNHLKELLPYMDKVQSLKLGNTNIGKEGALAIAQSSKLAKLQNLNLRGNGINNEGALAIILSQALIKLTTLDLSWNNICEEHAKAIIDKSLDLTKITNLTVCPRHESWY